MDLSGILADVGRFGLTNGRLFIRLAGAYLRIVDDKSRVPVTRLEERLTEYHLCWTISCYNDVEKSMHCCKRPNGSSQKRLQCLCLHRMIYHDSITDGQNSLLMWHMDRIRGCGDADPPRPVQGIATEQATLAISIPSASNSDERKQVLVFAEDPQGCGGAAAKNITQRLDASRVAG